MSDIKNWSTTASGNNFTPPDGWPEGMLPSEVNNVGRENMAAHRRQWEQASWFDYGHNPTLVTASSFSVPSDRTSIYTVGRRVRVTDGTTVYGRITVSSFADSKTTVELVLDSGTITSSISAVAVSILDANNTPLPYRNEFLLDEANTVTGNNAHQGITTYNGTVTMNDTVTVNGNLVSDGDNSYTGTQDYAGIITTSGDNTHSGINNHTGSLQVDGSEVYHPGTLTKVFPVAFLFPGEISANDERYIPIPGSMVLSTAVNVPNAKAKAKVAPSGGSVVFSVRKNGSEIGTITFADGANTGTYSSIASQSFDGDLDDEIQIRCTSSNTQGISDVAFSIYGTHSS